MRFVWMGRKPCVVIGNKFINEEMQAKNYLFFTFQQIQRIALHSQNALNAAPRRHL
jgi:hypothetical protein